MTFQQFLRLLVARKQIVLLTLAVTVATTILVSLLLPKQYQGTVSVLVDAKSFDSVSGAIMPAQLMPGYMATQVDIITSPRVGRRVVNMLKLEENASLQEDWRADTDARIAFDVWLSEHLGKKLDVRPSRESSVISISYTAPDPQFAAALANAFAQAYLEINLELKVEPARQSAEWFTERTGSLRSNLERAQARLSDFQREHGIVSVDERLDNESARLNELSAQLAAAQSQTADSTSRQRQAGSQPLESLPEVIQNPLLQQLRADITRLESKQQEMAIQLGKNHPQYRGTVAELTPLRDKLAAEMRRVVQGVGTVNRVNQQREIELKTAIETQKQRVLEIKKQRDEINVLVRDVDSAQKAYDAVSQRLTQTSLESKSNQTNVVILTPATEPLNHASPKIFLNVALAVFLGTLLGVGAALLLELTDQRIRSAEDIAFALELPVLGHIARERPRHSLAGRLLRPATA